MIIKKLSLAIVLFITVSAGSFAMNGDLSLPKWVSEQVEELESYLEEVNGATNFESAEVVVQLRLRSSNPMVKTAALLVCVALVKKGRTLDLAKRAALLSTDKKESLSVRLAALTVLNALNSDTQKVALVPHDKSLGFAKKALPSVQENCDDSFEESCLQEFEAWKNRDKKSDYDQKSTCQQQ